MNPVDSRFGDRLRRVRRFRKISQTELGHAVGMDNSVVSKIEAGQRRVTVGEAVVLAAGLDVPIDLLTTDGPLVMTVEL